MTAYVKYNDGIFQLIKRLNIPYSVLELHGDSVIEKIIILYNVTRHILEQYNIIFDIIDVNSKSNEQEIVKYVNQIFSGIRQIFKVEYPHGSNFSKNHLRYIKIYEHN